jgi:hypothetical protein
MHKVAAAHVNQMASLASNRLVHNGSNVDGPCGYGMKTRMAGCCDDGDELAHSCSCDVSLQGDQATLIFLTDRPVRVVVESAAAVARLTKAAETSLALVVAVIVYGNWIEVVMLGAALML